MAKTFSAADVATHNKPNDLYVVVDEDVYDLTAFQDEHPGMYGSSAGVVIGDGQRQRERQRETERETGDISCRLKASQS